MDRHFWRITGHAGMDQIFERIVPVDSLSDAAVCLLLQCLLAREVDINQLIDGFGLADTHGAGPLDVRMEPGPPLQYRLAGADVVFEASVMTERPPQFRSSYGSGLAA
ncbi:hypothetical protein DFI02_10874 [Rhizobium sp. PP-F2F-G20b]|nr:hypothetical protein DFI02_10874 [Rhizobium sp. PP-F2F-G20b]